MENLPNNKNPNTTEYHTSVIKKIEKAMTDMVLSLRERIDSGEYSLIISDETSARIPTLILRKIINERNKENNKDKTDKENETKTSFLTFRSNHSEDLLTEELFRDNKNEKPKRVLVVTEFVQSGKGLSTIAKKLKEYNIDFDFAIMRIALGEDYVKKNNEEIKDVDFFVGEDYPLPPAVWQTEYLTGVTKKNNEVHSKLLEKTPYSQEYINLARKDINIMAEKILEKVWG